MTYRAAVRLARCRAKQTGEVRFIVYDADYAVSGDRGFEVSSERGLAAWFWGAEVVAAVYPDGEVEAD